MAPHYTDPARLRPLSVEKLEEYNELATLYDAGNDVQRLHTYPTLKPHSVAAHSWGVAMLLMSLHPDPNIIMVRYALEHDLAEWWTGDIPYPAKKQFAGMKEASCAAEKEVAKVITSLLDPCELTEEEQRWVKACDMLELWMQCWREHDMGNRRVLDILITAERVLREDWVPEEIVNFMVNTIRIRGNYQNIRQDTFRRKIGGA